MAGRPGDVSAAVECRDVSFAYGRTEVLQGINLTAGGGITGLLGPNGAGKSTLLEILATVKAPKTGTVQVAGVEASGGSNIKAIRRRLGYLPQRFDLMMWSSCRRNVAYAAWCNGVDPDQADDAALAALAAVDLADRRDVRAGALSGGQRQRLGIACAIAHRPAVLLLDEPTVGLDPGQRLEIRDQLRQYAADACVLVSTHIVEDLAVVASSVVVINHGELSYQGTVEGLAADQSEVDSRFQSPLEAGYLAHLRRSEK
ncbi:MAG: ATP-binding cassette domain-containing protein [Bifidobacteriaceae bacterium]|jgi:ABC-2 type transport system ATP-binding protein|nr:ATP-binding cassette domain-containing protein [Bifidobacteriaceae bacterium]